ncbi:MAG: class I SAM-dependent methyltransferase [Nitrospirae bacterium]|nr:class I SAM-dependent methyltransferase [Nitrospirota bacterium]
MIDRLINGFADIVKMAVSHEAGRPRVHNNDWPFEVIWGSDAHAIEGCDYHNDIYIQQGINEFTSILRAIEALKERSTGLEIGFRRGGSHLIFREYFKKFISVELNPRSLLMFVQNSVLDERSEFIIGYSTSTPVVNKVKEIVGGRLDFVFIDGDHSFEGVKSDFLTYWPLLSNDGVLAIHDVDCPHVPEVKDIYEFVQELRQLDFSMDVVHIDYCGVAIIKKDERNRDIKLPENRYLTAFDSLPKNVRICLYGASKFGSAIRRKLEKNRKDIEIKCFIDTFKEGFEDGLSIINVKQLDNHMYDSDMILITSIYSREIEKTLISKGISNYKIAMPFLTDPAYGC